MTAPRGPTAPTSLGGPRPAQASLGQAGFVRLGKWSAKNGPFISGKWSIYLWKWYIHLWKMVHLPLEMMHLPLENDPFTSGK